MLNVAIHGMGAWGSKLIDSVDGSSKIKFVCGITRSPEKHQEYADKKGIKLVTSFEAALADKGIDAVVIATPHSQHEAQVIAAAKAGKAIYVEKPLALTQASAQRAVDAVKAAGVTMCIGFNRRYAPSFLEMMKRIKAGEDFAKLATELSKDPGSGQQGGDLGFFTKERMVPEFSTAAFALAPGQVSDPVKSQFGYHVIKLVDKREKPVPTYDEVKDQIEQFMFRKNQQETIKALRETGKIERIDPPAAPAAQ